MPCDDMTYEDMHREMDRIEAECCAELPNNLSTLAMRAEAVLNSDDPPRGDDENFCFAIADRMPCYKEKSTCPVTE